MTGDQSFSAQLLHDSIEVRNTQAQRIGHDLLGKRQMETGRLRAPDSQQAA